MEDVEDYYTFYVLILNLPEELFWYSDIAFVKSIVENKTAYDAWLDYEKEKLERRK